MSQQGGANYEPFYHKLPSHYNRTGGSLTMVCLVPPLPIPEDISTSGGEKIRFCPRCGTPYVPNRWWQKYCHPKCKRRSNYELNQEYRIEWQRLYRLRNADNATKHEKSRYSSFPKDELIRIVEKRDEQLASMQDEVDVRDRQIGELIEVVKDLKETVEGLQKTISGMKFDIQQTRPVQPIETALEPPVVVVKNPVQTGESGRNLLKSVSSFGSFKKG